MIRRRTWLRVGVIGAAVLATASAGVMLTTPSGFDRGTLSADARDACAALARAILDGRLPADAAERSRALEAYLGRLEVVIAAFPVGVQAEISDLLMLLSTTPGRVALTGVIRPWTSASVEDIQAGLTAMRRSSLGPRTAAYQALRDLTHAAWYADETRWVDMGYPGPTNL